MSLLLFTDSYKVSHWRQYPPNTETVYSYFEARRGSQYPYTIFFGLQYYLHMLAMGVSPLDIEPVEKIVNEHLGPDIFNREGWEYIIQEHGGKLPIRIKAVPEGSRVPIGNVLMTVENTDPKCFWLTNYLETVLSQLWYPITVATRSHIMRQKILAYLDKTGTVTGIPFKLHDFGFRGVSSVETAAIGGAAHLINFLGTDTMVALPMLKEFYDIDKGIGFSVPAYEHSTVTSWGRENEVACYRNALRQYPTGLLAVVSDSYDIYNACENIWGGVLKDEVLAREGTLIIRPDSGDPIEVLPRILSILAWKFGAEVNDKGYKVLNPKVRVIQGDGITVDSIDPIMEAVTAAGFSIDNLAFGSGGGLLQKMDRDTMRFAFKCSWAQVGGEGRDVFKKPATDDSKASKAGRLSLVKLNSGEHMTLRNNEYIAHASPDLLETVFENGVITKNTNFHEIRLRALAE